MFHLCFKSFKAIIAIQKLHKTQILHLVLEFGWIAWGWTLLLKKNK